MGDSPYIDSYGPKWTTPEKYIRAKLKILERDFCIHATQEEEDHLKSLNTQLAIDNAIISIMNSRWE